MTASIDSDHSRPLPVQLVGGVVVCEAGEGAAAAAVGHVGVLLLHVHVEVALGGGVRHRQVAVGAGICKGNGTHQKL